MRNYPGLSRKEHRPAFFENPPCNGSFQANFDHCVVILAGRGSKRMLPMFTPPTMAMLDPLFRKLFLWLVFGIALLNACRLYLVKYWKFKLPICYSKVELSYLPTVQRKKWCEMVLQNGPESFCGIGKFIAMIIRKEDEQLREIYWVNLIFFKMLRELLKSHQKRYRIIMVISLGSPWGY